MTCRSFEWRGISFNKTQIMTLFFVSRFEHGTLAKDLVDFLAVTSGAVTQVVDRLSEHNLLERRADPSDRRLYRIVLTPYASEHIEEIKTAYYEKIYAVFSNLTDGEIREMNSSFAKALGSAFSVDDK
jgi:DNA-binding MarR family transcriptional regulator